MSLRSKMFSGGAWPYLVLLWVMRWYLIAAAIIIASLCTCEAQGATYYISGSGNDANTGASWAQAVRNIRRINALATSDGDTVFFGTGIYNDTLLVLQKGTSSDWQVYACSSFCTAGETPVTNHPARITGRIITGWTNTSGSIWTASYTLATGYTYTSYPTLFMVDPNNHETSEILWRQSSAVAVNQAGEFHDGGGIITAWLPGNANPNNYEMMVAERKFAYLHDGSSISTQLEYVRFVGLSFEGSYNRTFSCESSGNMGDNLQWRACFFNNVVSGGGDNNSFIQFMDHGNLTDAVDYLSVRACSLGNSWTYTGTSDQVYSGNNAERIGVYALRYSVIDSNYFWGKSQGGIFFKCSHGDGNPWSEYDTVRHNFFDMEMGSAEGGSGIIFYGKIRLCDVYGNIFKGNNGVYCYYGGYVYSDISTHGQFKIFNNTFIGGGNAWFLQYDAEGNVALGNIPRNTQIKYNLFFHNYDADVVFNIDQSSYWNAGDIDSNGYYSTGGINWQTPSGTNRNQTYWQGTVGMDAHSTFSTNPSFDANYLPSTQQVMTSKAYPDGYTAYIYGAKQPAAPGCAATATAPTLISPTNTQTDLEGTVTFYWSSQDSATAYYIQVDSVSNAFTRLTDSDTTADTFATFTPYQDDSTYYWRVKAFTHCDTSDFSGAWSFTANYFNLYFVYPSIHVYGTVGGTIQPVYQYIANPFDTVLSCTSIAEHGDSAWLSISPTTGTTLFIVTHTFSTAGRGLGDYSTYVVYGCPPELDSTLVTMTIQANPQGATAHKFVMFYKIPHVTCPTCPETGYIGPPEQ